MVRQLWRRTRRRIKKSLREWWRENREHAAARSYIISFPKSGRTWLRLLIGKALAEECGLTDEEILNTIEFCRRAGVPPFRYTHDGSATTDRTPIPELGRNSGRYQRKRVLFLVRDPRDVVVSHYFEATRRQNVYEGDLSSFLRDDLYGLRKVIAFYNVWHRDREVPRDFMLMHYEELHEDTEGALRRALDFLGATQVSEASIRRAVEFSRFENMKKVERQGVFDKRAMRPRDASDNDTYKVRRGKVGGWRDYFTDDDVRWADQVLAETPCPFLEGG